MNENAGELPDGPLPPGAVRSFSGSLGKVQAIVREKLSIDLASPRLSGLKPLEAFLLDLQGRFGGTLLAVFRLGLYDALVEEVSSIAAELAARGASKDLTRDMLNAWIIAIHGSVPAPQARALVRPLEWVKRRAAETDAEPYPRPVTPASFEEGPEAPFLAALLGRRPGEAEKHLLGLLASGVPVERICGETIFPALRELGLLWQWNKLTVSEEHVATGMLRHAVYTLFGRIERSPGRQHGVTVTCAPGDEHELGAEIYALYLETKGWPVLFLGHSAPPEDVLLAIIGSRPFSLVISATLISHLPAAVDLAGRVKEEIPAVKIIAGGRAAVRAERALRGFADAVARTPEDCHAALENMARQKGESP
jgi:methanogenic corrinoid protein MtbC1